MLRDVRAVHWGGPDEAHLAIPSACDPRGGGQTDMSGYIARRIWQMIPTMIGVVLLVFLLFNTVGGDPAYVLAGKISNQEHIDNTRHQLGVDQRSSVQLAS